MNIKKYRLKDEILKAVQYNGTPEMAEELAFNYIGLEYDGFGFYIDAAYGYEEIMEDDFIIIEGQRAVDVMDGDLFQKFYEETEE